MNLGLAAAASILLTAACSASGPGAAGGTAAGGTAAGGTAAGGTVTVLAASSLTEPFRELGRRFEAAHPGVRVTFSFAASSTLVSQANAGAPADVLATADATTMDQAVAGRSVVRPSTFAHNRLAILVARGNPRSVRGLADLARPDLVVVLCAPEVPCGRYGAQALSQAGVPVRPRSYEPDVRGVLSKVALGEADAGIVYSTDVLATGSGVEGVTIPSEHNVTANYAIAPLKASGNAPAAAAFVELVLSDQGRRVLAQAGFDA